MEFECGTRRIRSKASPSGGQVGVAKPLLQLPVNGGYGAKAVEAEDCRELFRGSKLDGRRRRRSTWWGTALTYAAFDGRNRPQDVPAAPRRHPKPESHWGSTQ